MNARRDDRVADVDRSSPLSASGRPRHGLWTDRFLYVIGAVLSALLIVAAWLEWTPFPLDKTEVLAFVSGGWTVWLAARNNVWSWPIGVLNSAFFVVLFWDARLFFDMGLNVFYVLSGLWGWWVWSFGGRDRTEKSISRVGRREGASLVLVGLLLVFTMWRGGLAIDDAAPFPDALTTALSIVAQWLLMKRQIETWYFWIAADLCYIPLYLSRDLPLTALLYTIFLLLCLRGIVHWRAILHRPAYAESEGA